ncbi:hypothetical protein EJP77_02405 [Paenibacillus zeisoli]|uniref:Uncharacterized protein n=1 Tax=Paenibacillus zeisoli TaxID=2496267 RepID=A0A433XP77_9BACL|nr:hypothetical protein [Paenibacillus zeisoli]RUT35877.1 hypothetical protein EJP77_02405 [Paenibacillus zeisoli]
MRRKSPKWDPEYEDELDELIREVFITSPNSSLPSEELRRASWLKVRHNIQKEKRLRIIMRRFKLFGILSASFALGILLISPPTFTQAVAPIYQNVQQLRMGIAQVVFGKKACMETSLARSSFPLNKDKEEPHGRVMSNGLIKRQAVTLEEAFNNISFVLPILPTPPHRFK